LLVGGGASGTACTTVDPGVLRSSPLASEGAVTGSLWLTTSEGRFTAARTAAVNASPTTMIARILLSFSPVFADSL
jgi:hypothetical protein